MLPQLFYFLKGYVIIKVEGVFPERFLNLAMRQNVYIWDVEKSTETELYVKISVKGFLKLRSVAGKTGCKISIVKKNGARFITSKYKKRTALIFGMMLFVIGIIVFSSFVWKIEITGINRIDEKLLLAQLEKNGLKICTPLRKIDVNLITDKMVKDNEDIAWIIINLKGVRAEVDVTEKTLPPLVVDKDAVCNIVASKSGVIEDFYLRSGFETAKRGQTVAKGELLVSGVDNAFDGDVRYLNSDADITIRIWYQQNYKQPLEITEKVETGKTKTRFLIGFMGKEFDPLFFLKKYDDYVVSEKEIFVLPFGLKRVTYKEVNDVSKKLSLNEALELGKNEILNNIKEQMIDGKIDKCEFHYTSDGEHLNINAEIETVEKAVEKVIINK